MRGMQASAIAGVTLTALLHGATGKSSVADAAMQHDRAAVQTLLKRGEDEPPEDDPGLRPLNMMGEIGWEAISFAPNPARPEEFFALLKRPRH